MVGNADQEPVYVEEDNIFDAPDTSGGTQRLTWMRRNMKAITKKEIATEPDPAISRMERLPIQANGHMTIIRLPDKTKMQAVPIGTACIFDI